MTLQHIRPTLLPLLAIALINLANFITPLPVFLQLAANAFLSVYLGSIVSVGLGKATYKEIKQCQQDLKRGKKSVQGWRKLWEIIQYPAFGCVVLLTLYFFIKNSNTITINTLLDIIFVLTTTIYGSSRLNILSADGILVLTQTLSISARWQTCIQKTVKFVLCPLFMLSFSLLYITTKHWLLNNLIALFFAISTLKQTGLRAFTIAVPILWLLFLYDLYWVYHSDVMVTVAKNIDLPLKLLFPYTDAQGTPAFSMLGLGDIIIPGLFVSLCLKYDVDNCILAPNRPKSHKDFQLPLFYTSLLFYLLGIALTYAAMFLFSRPQPALVFIVPSLTLSLLFNPCFGNRFPLKEYNSSAMTKNNQHSQVI